MFIGKPSLAKKPAHYKDHGVDSQANEYGQIV
jgi:hypothetical protein